MFKNLCIIAILLLAGCTQKTEKTILLRLHLQPKEKFDMEIENHTEMALGSAYTKNSLRFLFQVDSVLGKDTGYVLAVNWSVYRSKMLPKVQEYLTTPTAKKQTTAGAKRTIMFRI